jgi:hypothetical protein
MTIITRVGFCEKCAQARRPKEGNLFLVYGSTSNSYYVAIAEDNSFMYNGYTPHVYILEKVVDGICHIHSHCSMNGCDVDVGKGKKLEYSYSVIGGKDEKMTIADWNALVMYRDKDYAI